MRGDREVIQGHGALEIAGRWSWIDLRNANIQGGTLNDFTAGLNWYWNPNAKMMFNYIHAFADHSTQGFSETSIYAVRAQIDF